MKTAPSVPGARTHGIGQGHDPAQGLVHKTRANPAAARHTTTSSQQQQSSSSRLQQPSTRRAADTKTTWAPVTRSARLHGPPSRARRAATHAPRARQISSFRRGDGVQSRAWRGSRRESVTWDLANYQVPHVMLENGHVRIASYSGFGSLMSLEPGSLGPSGRGAWARRSQPERHLHNLYT